MTAHGFKALSPFPAALVLLACLASGQDKPESGPEKDSGGETAGKKASAPDDRPVRVADFREVYRETPVTRAVDHGLRYLKTHQLSDGSWNSPGYGRNTGIVSLALMAYLARGHEPGRGVYGDVIDRGIAWILQSEKNGLIHRDAPGSHESMYSHGIATLLLGEVIGMVNESRPAFERLSRVHRRAVNVILRAQNISKKLWAFGGWRYTPVSPDSDISVTGWQLLALRAAQESGLPVPKKNIDQAVTYIRTCALPDGGFIYQPGIGATVGRTGTGVLALQICGRYNSAEALRGGDWLLANPLRWNDEYFYYGSYYGAQAMFQLGGEYWKRWQPVAQKILLDEQNDDGSWPFPPAASFEADAGPVYATAMAILALSVEFRYLPIYQR